MRVPGWTPRSGAASSSPSSPPSPAGSGWDWPSAVQSCRHTAAASGWRLGPARERHSRSGFPPGPSDAWAVPPSRPARGGLHPRVGRPPPDAYFAAGALGAFFGDLRAGRLDGKGQRLGVLGGDGVADLHVLPALGVLHLHLDGVPARALDGGDLLVQVDRLHRPAEGDGPGDDALGLLPGLGRGRWQSPRSAAAAAWSDPPRSPRPRAPPGTARCTSSPTFTWGRFRACLPTTNAWSCPSGVVSTT